MLYFIMIPLALSMLLYFIFKLVSWSPNKVSMQKKSPFECGFDPMSKMRKPFSMRFFLLIILFLIFDVEVVLLFPLLMLMKSSSVTFIITSILLFLLILLMGLFYEWKMGALDWLS